VRCSSGRERTRRSCASSRARSGRPRASSPGFPGARSAGRSIGAGALSGTIVPEPAPLRLHDEDPALFREAVRFTAAQTGFVPRLIEKDYFCTVVLEYLSPSAAELVFRRGTCLAKIHAEFYRLKIGRASCRERVEMWVGERW